MTHGCETPIEHQDSKTIDYQPQSPAVMLHFRIKTSHIPFSVLEYEAQSLYVKIVTALRSHIKFKFISNTVISIQLLKYSRFAWKHTARLDNEGETR